METLTITPLEVIKLSNRDPRRGMIIVPAWSIIVVVMLIAAAFLAGSSAGWRTRTAVISAPLPDDWQPAGQPVFDVNLDASDRSTIFFRETGEVSQGGVTLDPGSCDSRLVSMKKPLVQVKCGPVGYFLVDSWTGPVQVRLDSEKRYWVYRRDRR